jgi:hypothetical protein
MAIISFDDISTIKATGTTADDKNSTTKRKLKGNPTILLVLLLQQSNTIITLLIEPAFVEKALKININTVSSSALDTIIDQPNPISSSPLPSSPLPSSQLPSSQLPSSSSSSQYSVERRLQKEFESVRF